MLEHQKHRIQRILADIRSPRKKKVIVDTDAYNEMDDQFSILFALSSGIAGLTLSYYLGSSAGAAISLILALIFAVTFSFRKVRG